MVAVVIDIRPVLIIANDGKTNRLASLTLDKAINGNPCLSIVIVDRYFVNEQWLMLTRLIALTAE